MVPMSRPGQGGVGVSGGYSGANAMANNGLNPNQNQVKMINAMSLEYIIIFKKWGIIFLLQVAQMCCGIVRKWPY